MNTQNINNSFVLVAENVITDINFKIDSMNTKLNELIEIVNSIKNPPKVNFSVAEVAEYTSRTPGAIYQLISRDEIPHFKLGKKLLFSKVEIDNWINSRKRLTKGELKAYAEGSRN